MSQNAHTLNKREILCTHEVTLVTAQLPAEIVLRVVYGLGLNPSIR
ncbi:MAG: hypothetical protein RIQ39_373 [Actinomycetota bacterium]|jgi:hypothetical protein